jgi:tRNA(fMet)-specific endonuclease VapC
MITGRLSVSALSIAELEFGAAKSARVLANQKRIEAFTEEVPVEPFGLEMSQCFGVLKSKLARTGKKIGDFDVAIAAVAIVRGYIVVTHDGDFKKIPELRTEDWSQ